jgi:hypothetical protein
MTDELATARAEIAALRARITRLTTVTDEDVERVAAALQAVPNFWQRRDDWTGDHVKGRPYQVCRYGSGNEPEIIIIGHYASRDDADEAQTKIIYEARARAALEAHTEVDR